MSSVPLPTLPAPDGALAAERARDPSTSVDLLRPALTTLAGLGVLGAVAGLGLGTLTGAVQAVPSLPFVFVAAGLLTAPALLVAGPFLDLAHGPGDLVASLADGFGRAGRVAWGFVPVAAFFSLTTSAWFPMWGAIALLAGGLGLGRAARALLAAESRRGDAASFRRALLASGAWSLLTAFVGLRLLVGQALVLLD